MIDHTPSRLRLSHVLAGLAAVATALMAAVSPLTLATALVGCGLVAVALHRRSREVLAVGSVTLFATAVLVASRGATGLAVTTTAFAALLTYDFGEFAIDLSETVGPDTTTLRVEALHAVLAALVTLTVGGAGLAVYRSIDGGQSLSVVVLLFAAVVLVGLLGSDT